MNINFQDITKKDFFKEKLKGEVVSFGLVKMEEYPDFIAKLIDFDLLEFYFQKEYRGMLSYLRVLGDFKFSIPDKYAGSSRGWANNVLLSDGDFIEFSEVLLATQYSFKRMDDKDELSPKLHTIFVDYDIHRPEVRQEIYRKYNFDV